MIIQAIGISISIIIPKSHALLLQCSLYLILSLNAECMERKRMKSCVSNKCRPAVTVGLLLSLTAIIYTVNSANLASLEDKTLLVEIYSTMFSWCMKADVKFDAVLKDIVEVSNIIG